MAHRKKMKSVKEISGPVNAPSDTLTALLMNTAIFVGRLLVFQTCPYSVCINNMVYYTEALHSMQCGEINRNKLDFDLQPLVTLMNSIDENKAFPLISNGFNSSDQASEDEIQLLYNFESSIGEVPTRMVEWLIHHDTTTSHVRQLGGIMAPAMVSQLMPPIYVRIVIVLGSLELKT